MDSLISLIYFDKLSIANAQCACDTVREMENRRLVVAHRGGRSEWHENTLEAFQCAIDCGADMIEFDVRRAGDGELIVHHDATIGDHQLAEMGYPEAVRLSDAHGYRIPRLSELLGLARGRILLDIELKEVGFEERLLRLVFDHRFQPRDFTVTSFDVATLEHIRLAHRNVATGLLVENLAGHEALELVHQVGANFLGPDYKLLDDLMLGEAAAAGVPLLPWTVNDSAVIRRLLRSPAVAGIITDQTTEAMQIRNDEMARMPGLVSLSWRR